MKTLLTITLLVAFVCCLNPSVLADPVVVSGGIQNDYESWIRRLNDGRIMLVFCRNPDWASGDLYVTFSANDGASWTTPQGIVTDAGDQATVSFIQHPDDTIELFYASNETGSYGIHRATSLDGLSWTKHGLLDLGWSSGTTWYDPTVVLETDGSLTMSYIVSGGGVYVAHRPADGWWDTDQTNVSSSGYRARIMKHSDGTYLCAYHKRTGSTYEYDVFVTTSDDLKNWSPPVQLTTNQNSHDPFANQLPDGSYLVYYAKYTGGSYKLCRRVSVDAVAWEPEEMVTSTPTNDTQPHFFCETGWLYLSWAHAVDYPDDHDVYFEAFALPVPYVCGDVDGDSVGPNIADLSYLVAYFFSGGPPPPYLNAADINGGDGSVNIADLTLLVAYLFSSGPTPDCG